MDDDCQLLTEVIKPSTDQSSDHDDTLIAEVDIYLTRLFADQLYLFQYPLRSNHLQFENNPTFVGARIKPKNKLVELDYHLDSESNFYCQNHEDRVAQNWTSSSTAMDQSDKTTSIDHLTLASTNATVADNYKRFAVGIITPNGIQLAPLNAIFQLRPNFDVTSENSIKTITEQPLTQSDDEEEDGPDATNANLLKKQASTSAEDSATEEENNFKLVTMKYWRPEGRRELEKKLRSYDYFERARNEEKWIDFAYYSPSEPESIELYQQWMILGQVENNRLPIRWRKTISMRDYFQLLLCNEQLCLTEKTISAPAELNQSTEQKPVIVPPTKSKKSSKTVSDKSPKKTSKKSRNSTRTSSTTTTTSTADAKATPTTSNMPLSSVSLPQTIIKQDPETIQNELLSFMKRRFGYRPYFKLSEINIAIKLELISSPPGHPLASGVTEASILRAAIEIGAIHVNKKWPKNLKQEPVFINAQMGDKYDTLRRYVAELLERCDSFQFTELRSRIKQENQTQLFPVHEVKKFVRDHCITRSSRKGVLYCVKGTLVK